MFNKSKLIREVTIDSEALAAYSPATFTIIPLHRPDAVSVKSRGRQVVAAGSIHPDTGKHYFWDTIDHPALGEAAPTAPINLVEAIRRPQAVEAIGGGRRRRFKSHERLKRWT